MTTGQRLFEHIAMASLLAMFWLGAGLYLDFIPSRTFGPFLWLFGLTFVIGVGCACLLAYARVAHARSLTFSRRLELAELDQMRRDADRLATRNGYTYTKEHINDQ